LICDTVTPPVTAVVTLASVMMNSSMRQASLTCPRSLVQGL
jgi:hypothetical protein